MPVFLEVMVGGHPRAFAYPLLIAFLYYLTKKAYAKAALLFVLQSLFYPILFFISGLTYAFTSLESLRKGPFLGRYSTSIVYFGLAIIVSSAVLLSKYVVSYNPAIGTVVDRSQMLNKPEFYAEGRAEILPQPPLHRTIRNLLLYPFMSIIKEYPDAIRKVNKKVLNFETVSLVVPLVLLLVLLWVAAEIIRGKIIIGKEIFYLFVSGVIMYEVADFLLLKLFEPIRYLQYVVPLVTVIILSVLVGHLLDRLPRNGIRTAFKVGLMVLVCLTLMLVKASL